ncbi:MAG: murein biosynthesis integral membrane protein MurJ [Streptosporangiales bacterium]|nr:murein biosynthesis integral membrane protein MurJ [Streptosporangiales bacterium]
MAAGTVVSRATGFARTAAIAFALGTGPLGDAFNTALIIPFIVFDLLLGGILQSVVVPVLVRRRKQDPDQGQAYEQRLFSLVLLVLLGITALAVAAAGLLIGLYTGKFTPEQQSLAVTFARFFLVQIFFVGLGGLCGAMLNTRGRFGAPMWAPVLNNLVIIAVAGLFLAVTRGSATVESITPGQVRFLGLGVTCGMVVQAAVLVVALRAAGFRPRPRFDFRHAGLGEIGRLASWMLAYIVATQVGFLVITNLATRAGRVAHTEGVPYGAGFTPYNYAYQLFQLPYAIVAVSVITALLPRLSGYATERRYDLLREEFSRGLRMTAVVIAPGALVMAALGPPIAVLLFGHFNTSGADARFIGQVLTAFALGLMPFSVFQLLLRVFYALHDTRTPAFISVANVAVSAGVGLLSYVLLPPGAIVVGLAAGFGLSYVVGCVIAWTTLSRRLGGMDGRRVVRALVRLHLAAVPSLVVALAASLALQPAFGTGTLHAALAIGVGGGLAAGLYLLAARVLRATEITEMLATVRARLPGRA